MKQEINKKVLEYADDFNGSELNLEFWRTNSILEGRWNLQSKVLGSVKKGLKITVNPGDKAGSGGHDQPNERSEISERHDREILIPAGVNIWYAFSVYIPRNFKIVDNRLVFAQWHSVQSDKSPQMAWRYQNGNIFFTVQLGEKKVLLNSVPVQKGRWYRCMVNHQIKEDHEGYCQVFLDGKEFAFFEGAIGYLADPIMAYFKMGIYRDHVLHTDTLYFADFRRGLSRKFCEL